MSWLANIFSSAIGTLHCFLCCADLLVWCSSACLLSLCCHIQKSLPRPVSRSSSPKYSSYRSFTVAGLKSLNHHECIFPTGIRWGVQFHSSAIRYPVSPAPFIEETILFPSANMWEFIPRLSVLRRGLRASAMLFSSL